MSHATESLERVRLGMAVLGSNLDRLDRCTEAVRIEAETKAGIRHRILRDQRFIQRLERARKDGAPHGI